MVVLNDQTNNHAQGGGLPWFLRSSYPVSFPSHAALTQTRSEFDKFLINELCGRYGAAAAAASRDAPETPATKEEIPDGSSETATETFTLVSASTTAEIRKDLDATKVDTSEIDAKDHTQDGAVQEKDPNLGPFMQALINHDEEESPSIDMENKMLTENGDVAFRSTKDPLVDLFFELEDASGPRLRELLDAAWATDPLSTLKIIFNARSIHLGKGSKNTFYRAAGWLAQNHPLTLVANLRWLSRPVIEKKVKKEGEDDLVIVEAPKEDEDDISRFDVEHGVSHGYWKDLLNLLALAVNDKLTVLAKPRDVLNVENTAIKVSSLLRRARRAETAREKRGERSPVRGIGIITEGDRVVASGRLSAKRRAAAQRAAVARQEKLASGEKTVYINPKVVKKNVRTDRHRAAVQAFNNDTVYRALYLAVARLFAEQLQLDIAALRGSDSKSKKNIGLCAKWAPTQDHFHDRQTCIISSIAEILYPREAFDHVLTATDSRDTYLKHAREQYRKDISALRKHLEVVERDVTAQTFSNIKYDRLPSLAMKRYSKIFIQRDEDRFDTYIDKVAEGKARISGATLLPSTLVHEVANIKNLPEYNLEYLSAEDLISHKKKLIEAKVIDGQWNTLVQRIKDSGTLSSSIAVCDVSGSMSFPIFADKTCPLDAAIGLSLLIAEVTKPPFGGGIITFSKKPVVQKFFLTNSFLQKVRVIKRAQWGGNTNFIGVFERLILKIAIKNNLKQEDMVKRVFVFSDMQFDEAHRSPGGDTWASSFERIKSKFAEAGYEMPELVFWNLAGGKAGYEAGATIQGGDPTAPKPVDANELGTSLVSGYSPGMLKMFMENGSFDKEEEEEEKAGQDGEPANQKAKKDPSATVKRAISHKAYKMLQVLD